MHRKKGTPNTPQAIIDEIVSKHRSGVTVSSLAKAYGKPFKTIKSMCYRENRKQKRKEAGIPPKIRRRKAAVSLQEYKYENKRLKIENELLRDFLRIAGRR